MRLRFIDTVQGVPDSIDNHASEFHVAYRPVTICLQAIVSNISDTVANSNVILE